MQNREYAIVYMCVYGWYVCPLNARAGDFFLKKKQLKKTKNPGILGLTPVSSDTTALIWSYFKLRLKIVRGFMQKCLFFKSQKVAANGYYGIETLYQA